MSLCMRGSRGAMAGAMAGGLKPLENHKNIGFLSNPGLGIPLKIVKLPSQHSMLDHHLHVAGGPMINR